MHNVPENFLDEEMRCDYLVSNKMKKVWSVEIDLLCKLQDVCKKYGLTYYADSGTLIGAVRHKGFIPWDDDIDIVMMREDYEKLTEVAKEEFKYPYFFQNAHTDGFIRGFSRLRNSMTTGESNRYADININHGIFIDIFPLDRLPDNQIERKLWLGHIRFMHRWLDAVFFDYTGADIPLYKRVLSKCSKQLFNVDDLANRYDKLCTRYNTKNTKQVSYVAYSRGREKHIWNYEWFSDSYPVPFEYIEINIPSGYDQRLRTEYGDYMIVKHTSTMHGTMILEPDIPYKEYMSQRSNKHQNE